MIIGRVAAIKPLADAVLLEVLVRHEDVAAMINCVTPPPEYLIGVFNPAALNPAPVKPQPAQTDPVVVQLRPQPQPVEEPAKPAPVVDEMPPMPDLLNRLKDAPAVEPAPAVKSGSPFKVQ